MTVHIHYDGRTYTEANHDLADCLTRLGSLLDSPGGGFFRVETMAGTVDLYIAPGVPVAVAEDVDTGRPKVPQRIY